MDAYVLRSILATGDTHFYHEQRWKRSLISYDCYCCLEMLHSRDRSERVDSEWTHEDWCRMRRRIFSGSLLTLFSPPLIPVDAFPFQLDAEMKAKSHMGGRERKMFQKIAFWIYRQNSWNWRNFSGCILAVIAEEREGDKTLTLMEDPFPPVFSHRENFSSRREHLSRMSSARDWLPHAVACCLQLDEGWKWNGRENECNERFLVRLQQLCLESVQRKCTELKRSPS